jgi:tight adherence protein C
MSEQLLATVGAVDPQALLAVALVMVCIGALVGAVRAVFFRGHDAVLDRLRTVRSPASAPGLRQRSGQGMRAGPPKGEIDLKVDTRLAQMLMHAGLRHHAAVQVMVGAKVALAVLLPVGYLFTSIAFSPERSPSTVPVAIGFGIVGLLAPNLWLHLRVKARQKAISCGLPDALDLLVTCVEAGLGLDAAMSRVAGEIAMASPLLAAELRLTFLEIHAGIDRTDAFRRLAERTGVEDLRSLAATLTQSERFGTSIAAALRMRADWMRTRRMQIAEERAATVAVKMTVPLVFCVLPALMVIVIGPAIVRISGTFMHTLGR